MTKDANQPAGDPDTSDGLWAVWRWVITVAAVVILAFAFWLATSRNQSAMAAAALERSVQQYQAGQYQEAITSARAVLEKNPGSAEAYNNLAVAYLGLRNFDDAIHAAEQAIRLKPDLQLAKNNLAWIHREKTRAMGVPPQTAPSIDTTRLLNQSMQHAQTGRFEECIDTATQVTKLNPNVAEAFNNIGFCAGKLQRWDEAIQSTQEALRLNPNFQLARNNLTWLQQQRRRSGAAKVP